MKQRTSAVTRSPQQRSYVTQTRLARWHHSRSGPRSLGGDEPATKLLDSWEGADLCKPNEVWGRTPETGPKGLIRPLGSSIQRFGGHISSLSAPTKSDHVDGAATSPGFASPSEDPRLAEFSFLFVATRTQCHSPSHRDCRWRGYSGWQSRWSCRRLCAQRRDRPRRGAGPYWSLSLFREPRRSAPSFRVR